MCVITVRRMKSSEKNLYTNNTNYELYLQLTITGEHNLYVFGISTIIEYPTNIIKTNLYYVQLCSVHKNNITSIGIGM